MFSAIEIKAYRGLRDVTLDGLGIVNILVGENNTGKTSILEAIQMFRNKRVLENVISIANKRQTKSVVMRGNSQCTGAGTEETAYGYECLSAGTLYGGSICKAVWEWGTS